MCCRTYSAASAAASAGVGGALGALRGAEITAFPNVDAPLDAAMSDVSFQRLRFAASGWLLGPSRSSLLCRTPAPGPGGGPGRAACSSAKAPLRIIYVREDPPTLKGFPISITAGSLAASLVPSPRNVPWAESKSTSMIAPSGRCTSAQCCREHDGWSVGISTTVALRPMTKCVLWSMRKVSTTIPSLHASRNNACPSSREGTTAHEGPGQRAMIGARRLHDTSPTRL
mmetsp:Transcript_23799/g.45337  ORF Transcript_23799/g.45337 Transcript_23799/m.45337 type:complete len:228 (+) Transcript_23799:1115-1798(+)